MRGSAWEVEIGTERLQDKENKDLGDDDEINQVKMHLVYNIKSYLPQKDRILTKTLINENWPTFLLTIVMQ